MGDRIPQVEEGEVRWPVLFFYPEASMQSDVVEDFGEHDPIGAHLDAMFGGDAPPLEWDTDLQYGRASIEVYYLSHSAKPMERDGLVEALHGGWPKVVEEGPSRYGDKAAQWVRVHEGWTLGEVLGRPDHITPGIPAMFVLATGTPFKQRFLAGDVPLF